MPYFDNDNDAICWVWSAFSGDRKEVCASIDTEKLIAETMEPMTHVDDAFGFFMENQEFEYGYCYRQERELIEEFMEQFGLEKLAEDNTYNQESDLDSPFIWEVWGHEGVSDWIYSNCLVAIWVHEGGDVRGNYSNVKFYRSKGEYCIPVDLRVGWYCEGTNGPIDVLNNRCSPGYSSSPSWELTGSLDRVFECFSNSQQVVGVYCGEAVRCIPYVNIDI